MGATGIHRPCEFGHRLMDQPGYAQWLADLGDPLKRVWQRKRSLAGLDGDLGSTYLDCSAVGSSVLKQYLESDFLKPGLSFRDQAFFLIIVANRIRANHLDRSLPLLAAMTWGLSEQASRIGASISLTRGQDFFASATTIEAVVEILAQLPRDQKLEPNKQLLPNSSCMVGVFQKILEHISSIPGMVPHANGTVDWAPIFSDRQKSFLLLQRLDALNLADPALNDFPSIVGQLTDLLTRDWVFGDIRRRLDDGHATSISEAAMQLHDNYLKEQASNPTNGLSQRMNRALSAAARELCS